MCPDIHRVGITYIRKQVVTSLRGTPLRLVITHIFQKSLGSGDFLPANSLMTGCGVGRDGHQSETLNRLSKVFGLVSSGSLSFLPCGSGTSPILRVLTPERLNQENLSGVKEHCGWPCCLAFCPSIYVWWTKSTLH